MKTWGHWNHIQILHCPFFPIEIKIIFLDYQFKYVALLLKYEQQLLKWLAWYSKLSLIGTQFITLVVFPYYILNVCVPHEIRKLRWGHWW
jgi:hypothetical protein